MVRISKVYVPKEKEKYMCEKHLVFFKQKLTNWKAELVKANNQALYNSSLDDNSTSADIVYSSLFTGVHGSYLRGSIENAGMDPDNLAEGKKSIMNFSGTSSKAKAWKDIWGAGQGVGSVADIPSVETLVLRMEQEYQASKDQLTG